MNNATEMCLKSNVAMNQPQNGQNLQHEVDFKTYLTKEVIGDIAIFKCLQCPYMAFSIKDMKLHVGLLHIAYDGNKTNGLLMKCPGCPGQFFTETYLKTHLHSHHKMLAKDISKLISNNTKDIKNGGHTMLNLDIGDDKIFYKDSAHFQGIDVSFSKRYVKNYDQIENRSIEKLFNIANDASEFKSRQEQYEQINRDSFPNIEIIDDSQNNPPILENAKLNESTIINELQNADSLHDLTSQKDSIPVNELQENDSVGCNSMFQKNSIDSQLDKKGFKCDIQNCRVRLNSLENISYHKSCHLNNTKNLSCPECKKHFATIEELHNHLWRLHRIDLELHACDRCSYKAYRRNRLINVHMKIHSEERNYSCKICLKTFKNSKQLSKHSAIHRKKENIPKKVFCNICKREFGTKTLLTVHEKNVHEKIKLFSCTCCSYSTSLKSSLVLHMRCHTGEEPYHCSECDFKSANRGTLKRHLMVHSQQKRYECDKCSYSCIQASSIKAHVKLKHPGLKSNLFYSCSHCPYTTVNKANYSAHTFTHGLNKGIKIDKMSTSSNDLIAENVNKSQESDTVLCENISLKESDVCSFAEKVIDVNNTNRNIIEEIPNSNPIYVKNIIDLTSNSIRLNNTIFKNLSFDVDQNNTKNPILPIVGNDRVVQNWSRDSFPHCRLNDNGKVMRPDVLLNNDMFINSKSVQDNALSRKKPKISVKSNLILKGPDSVHTFNPQSSFGEYHSLPEIFLPQHLIFNEDQNNETGSEQILFDNDGNNESIGSDFHHISYDSFHNSEYSLQNFQSPATSMDAMNSDITQYILDENIEFLNKDNNEQLSIEMKGETNLNELLKTDLIEINTNDAYSAKNIQYSDNKSYLTLIQPSIKCEDKVNTEYFGKQNIASEVIHSFANNLEHSPVIEELPIIFYDTMEMENNNDKVQNFVDKNNDIITIDETSCDTKSLMITINDLKSNYYINEN